MGLFSKKKAPEPEGPDDLDPIENIVMLATLRFRAQGLDVDVVEGTSGLDTVLADPTGAHAFPLHTLIQKLLLVPKGTDGYQQALLEHVDSMVEAAEAPPIASISDDELAERVRIRLLPDSQPPAKQQYAQRVAPGLVTVLCIDNPTSLTYVNDADLEGRDVRSLFDAGFRNVMAEPIDQIDEESGIHIVVGESLFLATKAIGLGSMLGSELPAAPLGVIVGMPHRHAMFLHILTGPDSIPIIGRLAGVVAASAAGEPLGGPVSGSVYYWKDHVFEEVGGRGDDGTINIWPSERLTAVLRPEAPA